MRNDIPQHRKLQKPCDKTAAMKQTKNFAKMDNSSKSSFKFLGVNATGYQCRVEIDGQQHVINYKNDVYPRDSPNYAGWYNEQHVVEMKNQTYIVNSTPQDTETYEGPSPMIRPPVVQDSLNLKEVPCSKYCGQYIPWNSGRCNKCR